jgi:hypothetical protein
VGGLQSDDSGTSAGCARPRFRRLRPPRGGPEQEHAGGRPGKIERGRRLFGRRSGPPEPHQTHIFLFTVTDEEDADALDGAFPSLSFSRSEEHSTKLCSRSRARASKCQIGHSGKPGLFDTIPDSVGIRTELKQVPRPILFRRTGIKPVSAGLRQCACRGSIHHRDRSRS